MTERALRHLLMCSGMSQMQKFALLSIILQFQIPHRIRIFDVTQYRNIAFQGNLYLEMSLNGLNSQVIICSKNHTSCTPCSMLTLQGPQSPPVISSKRLNKTGLIYIPQLPPFESNLPSFHLNLNKFLHANEFCQSLRHAYYL